MGDALELFTILFLSEVIYGYLGVALMVSLAVFATKKERSIGFVWLIILPIMAITYYAKITATGYYMLHILILVMGEFFCGLEMMTDS